MSKTVFVGVGAIVFIIVGILFFAQSFQKEDNDQNKTESVPLELAKNESTTQASTMSPKSYQGAPLPLTPAEIKGKLAKINTSKGEIEFEFFEDAPLAASNFIYLAGDKFYDGLTFHRREEGFVIQGGDPSGNGTGGPGYAFDDEAVTRNYDRGIVAMANSGPNTNGSQFFIMLKDAPQLPKNYTIFGKVTKGMDVVDKIQVGDTMDQVTIE